MSFKKINGYIIHLKECIGRGSYGEVFKGEQEQTKRICAIKVLAKRLSTFLLIQSTRTSTSSMRCFRRSRSSSR